MLAKKSLSSLIFLAYAFALFNLIWRKKLLLFLHPDFLILAYLALIGLFLISCFVFLQRSIIIIVNGSGGESYF